MPSPNTPRLFECVNAQGVAGPQVTDNAIHSPDFNFRVHVL